MYTAVSTKILHNVTKLKHKIHHRNICAMKTLEESTLVTSCVTTSWRKNMSCKLCLRPISLVRSILMRMFCMVGRQCIVFCTKTDLNLDRRGFTVFSWLSYAFKTSIGFAVITWAFLIICLALHLIIVWKKYFRSCLDLLNVLENTVGIRSSEFSRCFILSVIVG